MSHGHGGGRFYGGGHFGSGGFVHGGGSGLGYGARHHGHGWYRPGAGVNGYSYGFGGNAYPYYLYYQCPCYANETEYECNQRRLNWGCM